MVEGMMYVVRPGGFDAAFSDTRADGGVMVVDGVREDGSMVFHIEHPAAA